MSLTNIIALKYAVPAALEVIKEKDEALYYMIECLDTCSGAEAIAKFLQKTLELNAHAVQLPAKQINWVKYSERFLTEKPALKVILDLFSEFGLTEISGIRMSDLLEAITAQE